MIANDFLVVSAFQVDNGTATAVGDVSVFTVNPPVLTLRVDTAYCLDHGGPLTGACLAAAFAEVTARPGAFAAIAIDPGMWFGGRGLYFFYFFLSYLSRASTGVHIEIGNTLFRRLQRLLCRRRVGISLGPGHPGNCTSGCREVV